SLFDEETKKILEIEEPKEEYTFPSSEEEKKQNYKRNLITQKITLQEHLLRQLRLHRLREKEYKIGEYIIANIDEDGYLKESCDEILESLGKEMSISKEEVEKIIKLIQTFDPVGVGATSFKECLLIQLNAKKIKNPIVYEIIQKYLSLLARKKLKEIAKQMNTSLSKIEKAAKIISKLDPKPGKKFSFTDPPPLITPDIIVEKINNRYEIVINSRSLPPLRISSYYKNLLNSSSVSRETKKYLQEKIKKAVELIKTLTEREKMIKKIVEYILQIQNDFFEEGDISLLKPLTLKELAEKIKKNESTVSRAVNKKYIQTPYGLFPLNYFFTSHFKTDDGKKISTQKIKSLILELIEEEKPHHSLKDSQLTRILRRYGIRIARRTVAKYRKELGIPSYSQRKKKKLRGDTT
ncbi:MAG: RNA polymerase sigma-54 factor, partial [Candidatus Omnitrophica bacterium 4484_70.1]